MHFHLVFSTPEWILYWLREWGAKHTSSYWLLSSIYHLDFDGIKYSLENTSWLEFYTIIIWRPDSYSVITNISTKNIIHFPFKFSLHPTEWLAVISLFITVNYECQRCWHHRWKMRQNLYLSKQINTNISILCFAMSPLFGICRQRFHPWSAFY